MLILQMMDDKGNRHIDLHVHSRYSPDGESAPAMLVERCKNAGITCMAIADHNTVQGVPEAMAAAAHLGVRCIPAIEIDCRWSGMDFHVLGYGIDPTCSAFSRLGDAYLAQELANNARKLELVNALGFCLSPADMAGVCGGAYTGESFAEALLKDPRYLSNPLLAPYRSGNVRGDNPYVNFYWDFFARGKPCYVEIVLPTMEEIVGLIHEHGGAAVLAHPGKNLEGHMERLGSLLDEGLDGIEAFSSYHDEETAEFLYRIACARDLLATCGSDYHGKTKPGIRLGGMPCPLDERMIEKQLERKKLI